MEVTRRSFIAAISSAAALYFTNALPVEAAWAPRQLSMEERARMATKVADAMLRDYPLDEDPLFDGKAWHFDQYTKEWWWK